MQVSLAPNRDVEIIIFLGLVCALLFDLRTQHINATHTKTHIVRPPITQITTKQQMYVSRWVGKADFATGSHRDTQTSFCISPLAVNCVFAYNIFLLDVIRLVVNIGQYHRRRIRADRHTCMETDMQACVYACTHTRTHAYIHKYTCCFFCFFLTTFRQRQHRQLPIVQHVRFTPQRLSQ